MSNTIKLSQNNINQRFSLDPIKQLTKILWLPDSLCAFIHPANRTDYNTFSLATIFALVSIVHENLCENISRLAWITHCQRHRSNSRFLNIAQDLCLYFSLLHWTHILVKLNTQAMRSDESVWLQSRVTSPFKTSWVVWLHVIDNHMRTCLKCSPLDLTYWHRPVLSHWRLKSKSGNTKEKVSIGAFQKLMLVFIVHYQRINYFRCSFNWCHNTFYNNMCKIIK